MTSPSIRDNLLNSLDDGSWGLYEGHWTSRLVEMLADHFQCQHVLACSSGTIAVELALRGLLVGPGDEVIMAGYDFPGNFRAIEAIGAFPVLVDVVPDGWVIDPTQIEEAVTEKTRAIVVSHLHGQIADMNKIRDIVSRHHEKSENRISIVEDVCQTPGASLRGRPLGTFGDVAALSFGGSKLLSAGRGGAVFTRSAEILQRAKIFNSRGNEAFPLSQLQAAVLLPQLEQLNESTIERGQAAAELIAATQDIEILSGLSQVVDSYSANEMVTDYYKLPWLLKDRTNGWSRSDFIAAVQAEGLPIDVGFRGFLRRSPRRCRRIGILVNSQVAAQQTLLLHHPILRLDAENKTEMIAAALRKVAMAGR